MKQILGHEVTQVASDPAAPQYTPETAFKTLIDIAASLGWDLAMPNTDPIRGFVIGAPEYIDAVLGIEDHFPKMDKETLQ